MNYDPLQSLVGAEVSAPVPTGGLGTRLVFIAVLSAGMALFAAAAIQIIVHYSSQRSAAADRLQSIAMLTAANSVSAVEFDDHATGTALLASLKSEAGIEQTLLFAANNKLIASFSPVGYLESEGTLGDADLWLADALNANRVTQRFVGWSRAEIIAPVFDRGLVIGRVYISMDLQHLRDSMQSLVALVLGTTLLALAVAWLLARRLQATVTLPFIELLDVTRDVTRRGDYSLRAAVTSNDEVGALTNSFNSMLQQIADRDHELQRNRETLEGLVAERTRNLERANASLCEARDQAALALSVARTANKLRADFVTRLSQEIRLLLKNAFSMSEMLLDAPPHGPQRRFADAIQSSAEALLQVSNDVLDFARVTNDGLALESADFDLRRITEESTELFARRATEKSIELILDIDPGLRCAVRGDALRLRQVFTNLIANAVKFTTRGSVVVRLRQTLVTANSSTIHLEVIDTGIGIRKENQAVIFEASVAEEGRASRRPSGAGMGLCISRQLVELMGGSIGVESEFGRGSTFFVDLQLAAAQGSLIGSINEFAMYPGKRLLIADDNTVNREILHSQLTSIGYEVELAADGAALVAACREGFRSGRSPDLLIIDANMPGLSGAGTLAQLRNDSTLPRIPAILLSALSREFSLEQQRSLAPATRLNKPIRQAALRRTVAQSLAAQQQSALRVLLVDENAGRRDFTAQLLTTMGCTLEFAPNGLQALELLAIKPCHCLLLACDEMADMAVFATVRALRQLESEQGLRRTWVMALSNIESELDRTQCLLAGMDDYLGAPLTAASVGEALRRIPRSSASLAAVVAPENLSAVFMAR